MIISHCRFVLYRVGYAVYFVLPPPAVYLFACHAPRLCTVRDRRLARDWDDLVKKVRLMMAAYETLPSSKLYVDIEIELMVLDNVCRKWVGDGLLYRPELRCDRGGCNAL